MTLTSDRFRLLRKVWRGRVLLALVYVDRLTGCEVVIPTVIYT